MAPQHWIVALLTVLPAAQAVVNVHDVFHRPAYARHGHKTVKRSVKGTKYLPVHHDQSDITKQAYTVKMSIGTPPQENTFNLVASQSGTWVIDDGVFALCDGCDDGYYQLNKSKTSSRRLGYESIGYGDPTTIPPSNITFDLDLHQDKVDIAGWCIPKQEFGLLTPGGKNKTLDGIGAFGVGPNLKYGYQAGKPFNSILDNLAAEGHIAGRTYSLDLRSYESKEGALIFGGIDTGRFKGKLVKRDLVKDELGTWGPSIVLTGYGQTLHDGTQHNYEVHEEDSVLLLDTANQYLRLRHSFVDPLYKHLGAKNNGHDAYYVPCSMREMNGTWDFHFGQATIKIPYKSLITELRGDDEGKTCQVGVLTTWKGQLVMGQPFMQAAVVAYDFDNQKVALAQPADCGHNIVAFGSGPDAIPELQGC